LINGFVQLPWTIKPIFGFISDKLPIFGYRRKSYLIITTVLEMCLLFLLAYGVTSPEKPAMKAKRIIEQGNSGLLNNGLMGIKGVCIC
jgi:BT1 family